MADNTGKASNVSVGKPKVAGAISVAPIGTALPTDASTALAASYKTLGYISEDGVKNNISRSSSSIKAWGGKVVATPLTEFADSFGYTLIETLNDEVLKHVFGSDNVAGTLSAGLTVHVNEKDLPNIVAVIDILLTGGKAKRIVIPNGKVSELGEISYKDSEATGYAVTLSALPDDASGDTHIEYIK